MKYAGTLVDRVRVLAAKYPEGLYAVDDSLADDDECSYTKGIVENGPPTEGCLIGQAARGYIAIPPEADRHGIVSVLDDLGVEGSKPERDWLENVQTSQDGGYRWAEAVATADQKQTGRRNP